jgi:hypothetical protein
MGKRSWAQTMADQISYDKFFPAIPLVGTTIAVCFDVGYFWGVGIDYFTLFSLTEHIGFALEALPAALVISIWAMLTDAVAEVPASWSRNRMDKSKRGFSSPREKRTFLIWKLVGLLALLVFLSSVTLALIWYLAWLRVFVLGCVVVAMMVAILAAGDRWYASGPIFLLIVGSTAALLLGEFNGSSYIAQTTARDTIVLKSGDTISVNVIRSGERGVLYAKPAPPIVEFDQWEAIRSLSRPSHGSLFDSKTK